jgi:hypothetical protein
MASCPFPQNDAQTLMLDIGRLAYRRWSGKICGNLRRVPHHDEKLIASQGASGEVSLTSIVDPDKVLQLVLRSFAIAMIKSRIGR